MSTQPAGMVYQRPWIPQKPYEAIFCPERVAVVEGATKTAKTSTCMLWLAELAFEYGDQGRNFWWISSTYASASIAFNRLKHGLPVDVREANESKQTITVPNGAVLSFKSAEKPDHLYGEAVFGAVCDEATRWREEAWHAVRTTLTSTRGPVRLVMNVRGRKNWAYRLARRAEAGEDDMKYTKLTAYDAVEAGILTLEDIEDARRDLPDAVFRELYLSEASEDGSNPFGLGAINACIIPALSTLPPAVWGVDLAKSADYTVPIALDRNGDVCRFERWQGSWETTIARLQEMIGTMPALVDSTGVGDPVLEALQRGHGGQSNFEGFKFSAASKQQLMEGLAVAIQQGEIRFPDGLIAHELRDFEFEYSRTGVHYSAPVGAYDDCVCALALAQSCRTAHGVLRGPTADRIYIGPPRQSPPGGFYDIGPRRRDRIQ